MSVPRPLQQIAAAFLILAILMALPFLLWGERVEAALDRDSVIAGLAEYRGYAWAVAVGLLVSDLLLPIPNTVIMAALGVLYGPFLGGLIATLGNCLSGLLGYGLCRWLGRRVSARLLSPPDVAHSEALFARSGGWAVALSRWLPIIPEVICCMAGLARMRFSAFALALVCGAAPFGFTVAAIGHAGSGHPLATLALCALLPIPLWAALQRVAGRRTRAPFAAAAQEPVQP